MRGARKAAYPYAVYAFTFFTAPLLLILFYSLTRRGPGGVAFTLDHFARFFDFSNPQYMKVLWNSFRIAFYATALCLLLGFPAAYVLANLRPRWRNFFSMLFIIPMWMNFLLRTYAWMALLETNGIVNTLLQKIGLPALQLMYTERAVVLGMVYNFLPL